MTDLGSAFEQATTGIDTLVSTQLSSALTWINVPGGLTKASQSEAGYVWGYNSNNAVYICPLPCTGNWSAVDISEFNIGTILDLTTDSTSVYVLITNTSGATVLLTAPASNQGTWNMIPVPFPAVSIFSTNTYIWAQDKTMNKQRCAKPCTTSNWTAVPENKVTITSSSNSALYGVDATSSPLTTDETLQTGWTPISGLAGLKVKTLVGEADKTAIYGIDSSSNVFRCEGSCIDPKSVQPVSTGGYNAMNLTISPVTKKLWMTSFTEGSVGNVFTRLDTPDYTSITNEITPLDQQRDKIKDQVKTEYSSQTNSLVASKQIDDVVTMFKNLFTFPKDSKQTMKREEGNFKKTIQTNQLKLDQISSNQPVVQVFLIATVIAAFIYIVGSFMGPVAHVMAAIALIGGLIYGIFMNKTNSPLPKP